MPSIGCRRGARRLSSVRPYLLADDEAKLRRTLSPVLFPSWQATCKAFGTAIWSGPGLVVLAGAEGSGKTFTLLAFAAGASSIKVGLRNPDQALDAGIAIDLVDDLDAQAFARLAPFQGTRVVAVHPRLVPHVLDACPHASVVTVPPMTSRDVRMMVEVRRPQLQLPLGSFSPHAVRRLDELALGNPRRLDDLIFRSLRIAAAAVSTRIRVSPGHVEQAARHLQDEGRADPQTRPFIDREAEWSRLGRTGPEPDCDRTAQGSRSRTSERRDRHPPSAGSVPVRAEAPAEAARQATAVTFPMGGRQPPRRRVRRRIYALATAAVAALVITASQGPVSLPWAHDGGADRPEALARLAAPMPREAAAPDLASVPSAAAVARRAVPDPGAPIPNPTAMTPPGAPFGNAVAPTGQAANARRAAPSASPPMPEQPETALATQGPPPPSPPARPSMAAPDPATRQAETPAPADASRPRQLAGSDRQAAPASPPMHDRPESGGMPPSQQGKPAEAARLLSLGKALVSIDQTNDAIDVLHASAAMGNAEAASILASYQTTHPPRRPSKGSQAGRSAQPRARNVSSAPR